MEERQYLPSIADLIDRASIVQMKIIFIPEHKEEYNKELNAIIHDLTLLMKNVTTTGEIIRAIIMTSICNREIWLNESKARLGGAEQDKLLKFTHSVNGIRNLSKNVISNELGERIDLRIDCLAADLPEEFGNWNVFVKDK
jgi:hypothetical protein